MKSKTPVMKKSGLMLIDFKSDIEDLGMKRMRARLERTYAMNNIMSSRTDMQNLDYHSQTLVATQSISGTEVGEELISNNEETPRLKRKRAVKPAM